MSLTILISCVVYMSALANAQPGGGGGGGAGGGGNGGRTPVYQYVWTNFFSNDHFYTTDASVVGTTTPGTSGTSSENGETYRSEGVAFELPSTGANGQVPLYEYYCSGCVDHLYTTDPNEVTNGLGDDWVLYYGTQSTIGNCYSSDSATGLVALYRYYNLLAGDNLLTTDVANVPFGYGFECIVCYVYPSDVTVAEPFAKKAQVAVDGLQRSGFTAQDLHAAVLTSESTQYESTQYWMVIGGCAVVSALVGAMLTKVCQSKSGEYQKLLSFDDSDV